jgi:hypothetical protein
MPSNIIDTLKGSLQTTEERLIEDRLYEAIHHELETNDLHPAAHTRAIAEGGDSEGLIKQAYIKHRLRMLKDELEFANKAALAASEKQRFQREQDQRDADAYRQAKLDGRSDEQIELDRKVAAVRRRSRPTDGAMTGRFIETLIVVIVVVAIIVFIGVAG